MGYDYCDEYYGTCETFNEGWKTTIRYCIFLGIYGIMIAALGIASLYVDKIPTEVPLVVDSIGALFYLAGGIAWAVRFTGQNIPCSVVPAWATDSYIKAWLSACKRCEADAGLAWSLFVFTALLAICGFLRRRDQVQSSK